MTDKLYLAKQVAKMVAEADCASKGGSVSEHFGMVLLNRVNELEAELQTIKELIDDVVFYAKKNPSSSPQCLLDLIDALGDTSNE